MPIRRNIAVFLGFAVASLFLVGNTRLLFAQDPSKQTKIVVTEADRIAALETAVTKLQTDLTAAKKQITVDEASIASTNTAVASVNKPPQGWERSFATFHTIKSYDDQKVAFFFMTHP